MGGSAAIIALLGACGVPLPAPTLEAVEPGRGWNGEDTLIEVTGDGFVPQVRFDASATGEADLDRDFSAFLVDDEGSRHALSGVSAESYEVLSAIVTAGLVPGQYDLEVVAPSGARSALPDAFVVSDTRADRVDLDSSDVSYDVGEIVTIEVALLDPNGERVLEDASVELRASAPDGPVTVGWGANAFEDQTTSTDTAAISGRLGSNGYALVSLHLYVPQTVTFTLTPLGSEGLLGDELKIAVTAGNDLQVSIALPEPEFEAVAGVPFDAVMTLENLLGEVVYDREVEVLLVDSCGSYAETVTISGVTTVPVTVTTSTDPHDGNCTTNRLILDDELGESDDFTVSAAEPERFRVEPVPLVIDAGDDILLTITPEDAWGNPSPWAGTLTWDDGFSSGPLDDCQVGAVVHTCSLLRTRAAAADVVRVIGDDGTFGISTPFVVQPDDVVDHLDATFPAVAEAGVPATVTVEAHDAWDNVIDASTLPIGEFAITDAAGDASCAFVSFPGDMTAIWECTFTVAGTADVTVTGPDGSSANGQVVVVNGPVAAVSFDLPAQVTAGSAFVIAGEATDAWGNPVVVASDPVLDLEDESFTLSPDLVTLDGAAGFDVLGTLTRAGSTRISAFQGGVLLGTSDPVSVVAAAVDRLGVEPVAPWVWVGESAEVVIEALDLYDNRAAWDGSVDVDGTGASAAGIPVVDGLGTAWITWSGPVASELLTASSADLAFDGVSRPFHVAVDCDADPAPVLQFGGEPVGRACFDPSTRTAALTGSFAGSASAGAPLTGYALAVGDQVVTGADDAPSVEIHATGRYDAGGLVLQSDGCGSEIWTSAWVGPDDGTPVGPLSLVPVSTPIDVLIGATDLELLGARDCSGDVAAFSSVWIRADLGDLSGVAPTGSGLSLALDGAGDGVATLSMAAYDAGGQAIVSAWVETGAAAGVAVVDVEGDSRRPVVWAQEPEGEALGTIDAIRVSFSEALRPESLAAGAVVLDGPSGPEPVFLALEDADRTLVATPASPIDGSAGAWLLTLTPELRDTAGNRLDGTFTGLATDWTGAFGAVGAFVDPAFCAASTGVLRPDGDDGAGAEADDVEVTVSSVAQPDRWEVAVSTGGLDVVRRRDPALAPVEILQWDARDAGGRVVANGLYDIDVTPLDGAGNRGVGCRVSVTVDNAVVVP